MTTTAGQGGNSNGQQGARNATAFQALNIFFLFILICFSTNKYSIENMYEMLAPPLQ